MRRRLQGRRKCVSIATATIAIFTGDQCRRQGRRNLEADVSVLAATTVAVTSAWLGDLIVAASVATLGDVADTRRERTAVVALVMGGVMVVACGIGWCDRWWAPGSVGARHRRWACRRALVEAVGGSVAGSVLGLRRWLLLVRNFADINSTGTFPQARCRSTQAD